MLLPPLLTMAAPTPQPCRRLHHLAAHLSSSTTAAVPAAATPPSFRLDGKVAFVTGGARHFGHEICTALAAAGAQIILTSRTEAVRGLACACAAFPLLTYSHTHAHKFSHTCIIHTPRTRCCRCCVLLTQRLMGPQDAVAAAANLSTAHGVDALGLALDVREWEAVKAAAATAEAWKGHVDILVNNAGGDSVIMAAT